MNFTSSETDFVLDNEAYVPVPDSEKRRIGSIEELEKLLALLLRLFFTRIEKL